MYCTYTAGRIAPSKIALLVVYVATCYQLTEHVIYALPIVFFQAREREQVCGIAAVRLETTTEGGMECLGGGGAQFGAPCVFMSGHN